MSTTKLQLAESRAIAPTRSEGVLDSLLRSNEGWIPAYGGPAPVETCRAALKEAEAMLVPVDPRYVAVELDRTLGLWGLPENWDDVAEFYMEVLEDAPADLVDLALRRLRSNHGYESFPKPGDLRRGLRKELNRRWADYYTAKQMLYMAENHLPAKVPPRPTEEDRAKVEEIMRPFHEAAAKREAEERERRKPNPRPVNEVHSPAGMIRLEAGFWFAYPKDGEPNKLGPFEAAVDAQRALKGD